MIEGRVRGCGMSSYANVLPGGNADGANLQAACPECDRLRAEVERLKADRDAARRAGEEPR